MTRTDSLGFFAAYLGLLLDPSGTATSLIQDDVPRYSIRILLLFLITLFGPLLYMARGLGIAGVDPGIPFSLMTIFLISIFGFFIFELIFLTVLAFDFSPVKLFFALFYCLVPVTTCLWCVYGFNMLTSGSLTLLTKVLTGMGSVDQQFVEILPWALLVLALYTFLLFYFLLREIVAGSGVSSLITSLFSLIPLTAAFFIGVVVSKSMWPETTDFLIKFVLNPEKYFSS